MKGRARGNKENTKSSRETPVRARTRMILITSDNHEKRYRRFWSVMDANNKKAQDGNDVGHVLLHSLIQMLQYNAEDEDGAGGRGWQKHA